MIHRIVCVVARVFHGRARAEAPFQALEEHTQPLVYFDTQDTGPAYIRMQNPLIQHSHSAAHVWCHGPWSTRRAIQFYVNLDAFDTTIVSQSVISRPITDIQLTYDLV